MPFAPGIENRSGEFLARGLESLGEGLGRGLEIRKQRADESKTMRRILGILDPQNKDKFETMGYGDLRGEIDGRILRQAAQIQEREAQSSALRDQLSAAQTALLSQQLAQQEAHALQDRVFNSQLSAATHRGPAGLQNFLSAPGAGGLAAPAPDPAALLQFAASVENPSRQIDGRALLQFAARSGFSPERAAQVAQTARHMGLIPDPAKPAAPPALYPAIDPITRQPIPGMALTESGSAVQTGERGELKDLSQADVDRITALNQAKADLDVLEKLYAKLDENYGGPVAGRVRSAVGSVTGDNADIIALQNAVTAATPNLARGVFREVGVLTAEDERRYKSLLPQPTDSAAARGKKIQQLRDRIEIGKKETMDQLRRAGRDVSGFDDSQPSPGARFDSEAEARAQGYGPGSQVWLYDPQKARYRLAILE